MNITIPDRTDNLYRVWCPKTNKPERILPWNLTYRAYDFCPNCGDWKNQPSENRHRRLSDGELIDYLEAENAELRAEIERLKND
jgi:hypothetical protein